MIELKRVLLVEDNPDDVALAQRAMSRVVARSELIVAKSVPEALAFFFDRAGPIRSPLPDLTLLDLKLPGISGLHVLKRIRTEAHTRTLPVVVLTTSRERQDIDDAYALGANSYILKPVQFERFVELMRNLLSYWLALNESPVS